MQRTLAVLAALAVVLATVGGAYVDDYRYVFGGEVAVVDERGCEREEMLDL